MQAVEGIHHITAFASNPQANVDFYHHVLGQRLVKTTVNFDDPGTYHFYYGDNIGSPGTIMTYFPWPQASRGRPGNGEIGAVAYAIAADSLDYWQQRLVKQGLASSKIETRFGAKVLPFCDPDGMQLELISHEGPSSHHFWAAGPIPVAHALHGFHSVTLWLAQAEPTAILLTQHMGYELVGQEGQRWRFKGAGNDMGLYVDIVVDSKRPYGRIGAGSVHHVAFRTRDDAEQLEYQQVLGQAGFGVTEVKDRQYFHSIYFRSPGGVLFEIATDAPGFGLDETLEKLGQSLKLPPWLEIHRQQIEAALPQFKLKPVEKAEQGKVAHV